jgi:hypothetical protein
MASFVFLAGSEILPGSWDIDELAVEGAMASFIRDCFALFAKRAVNHSSPSRHV